LHLGESAGLVERAARRGAHRRKRERKPCEGMLLHQDGSRAAWLGDQPTLDLIVTMDDATSTIYSALLVEEEGTPSTFAALLEVFGAQGLPASLYTDRGSHYFFTPKAGDAPCSTGRTCWRPTTHRPSYCRSRLEDCRVIRFDARLQGLVDLWTDASACPQTPQAKPNRQKRTFDVLPNPDIFKSYRHIHWWPRMDGEVQ
jgi:hypothetical protein